MAPICKSSISLLFKLLPQASKNPLVKASNSSISRPTFDKSTSSSSPLFAPKRMESPKSNAATPGIIVSKSITHNAFFVSLSNKILLSLVSLCVTFKEISLFASALLKIWVYSSLFKKKSISSLTFFALPKGSSFICALNVANLSSVLWKFFITSLSLFTGKSAKRF